MTSTYSEVLEEVGLHVDPAEPLHMWSWQIESGGSEVVVVAVARLCTILSGRETTAGAVQDDHISDLHWWAESELGDLDVIPSQKEAIQKIAELLGRSPEGHEPIEDHHLGLDSCWQDDARTPAGCGDRMATPTHVNGNELDRTRSEIRQGYGLATL